MGEVERNSLNFWCQKITNDPELLPEDKEGRKQGAPGFDGKIVKTYCNISVQRICRGLGYDKLDGMLANQMHEYLSKNWIIPAGDKKDKMLAAYNAGKIGDLAILAQKGNEHGHVAIVAPREPMLFSGKWGLYVPQVANVGKTNGFMGANWAFPEVPDVFVLGRTIT